jgi:hypothetical protein
MLKYLFFDNRDLELIRGFTRQLTPPAKRRDNPIFRPRAPWEAGRMSLYGSVVRRPDDLFQMWYTIGLKRKLNGCGSGLAYAESRDGIDWSQPELNVVKMGAMKTNIVFQQHAHGPSVIFDEAEPRDEARYKMISGAMPSNRVGVFMSADGIHWQPAGQNPVISSNPDCPMSLQRQADGLYAVYVRPRFADRRVGRSESWDFREWTRPKMVLDPDAVDPPQTQFYGMGAVQYGGFEIGTLWIYHTVAGDTDWSKMQGIQEAELAWSRSGYSWHRPAAGTPWIPHGKDGAWDRGCLQCASSPVFCDDEVRFYYAGGTSLHNGHPKPKSFDTGLGLATCKPDRFAALAAGDRPGEILTRGFAIRSPEIFVNADVSRGGSVTIDILGQDAKPLRGFRSLPITGDGVALPVLWKGAPNLESIVMKPIRFRLTARKARLYSVWMRDNDPRPAYHRFRVPQYNFDPVGELSPNPWWW